MDWTGCPAVNGIEPRNLVTLGSCPRCVHTGRQHRPSRSWRATIGDPGSKAHSRLHMMSIKQPVRSQQLLFDVETNHGESSMHVQAEEARSANGPGKSDGRIVPQKPAVQAGETKLGNASEGKAAKPSREPSRTPTVLSDGHTVLKRLDRITERAERNPKKAFNNLFSLLNDESASDLRSASSNETKHRVSMA